MTELAHGMTEAEADKADFYGFDYATPEEVEAFREWWQSEGRFQEPPLRDELQKRGPDLARLDGEMRAVLGIGIRELRDLLEAATDTAFTKKKVEAVLAKLDLREDPVLDRWLVLEKERVRAEALAQREREKQEAEWAAEEEAERQRLAAEAEARREAEAAEAKRLEGAFTAEERAAIRRQLLPVANRPNVPI